ncbi:MAG: 30S ribosomal protein S20 [Candidatus Omnitrophica bacterium]|nr:30S ribosomal protein S20 [Candidatus Omnitrophota bacterium]
MPNKRSAKKSLRQDKKKQLSNQAVKSELKTLLKKLESLISTKKQDEAKKLLSSVMSKLDKAAKKGVIKKHNAARKKSRLSKRIVKLKA